MQEMHADRGSTVAGLQHRGHRHIHRFSPHHYLGLLGWSPLTGDRKPGRLLINPKRLSLGAGCTRSPRQAAYLDCITPLPLEASEDIPACSLQLARPFEFPANLAVIPSTMGTRCSRRGARLIRISPGVESTKWNLARAMKLWLGVPGLGPLHIGRHAIPEALVVRKPPRPFSSNPGSTQPQLVCHGLCKRSYQRNRQQMRCPTDQIGKFRTKIAGPLSAWTTEPFRQPRFPAAANPNIEITLELLHHSEGV
jgi:hypothetical protein